MQGASMTMYANAEKIRQLRSEKAEDLDKAKKEKAEYISKSFEEGKKIGVNDYLDEVCLRLVKSDEVRINLMERLEESNPDLVKKYSSCEFSEENEAFLNGYFQGVKELLEGNGFKFTRLDDTSIGCITIPE